MVLPLCTTARAEGCSTPQHPPARREARLPLYLEVLGEAQLRKPPWQQLSEPS